MSEPSYYIRYINLLQSGRTNDEASFLQYLESLFKSEWKEFLLDLFNGSPYPSIIQRDRKDYPAIAYFPIFINKLSPAVKEVIATTMDQLASDNLSLETAEAAGIFIRLFELSRQLEWGLSSSLIIRKIILNQNFTQALRYDAAILLSFYRNDPEALEFWRSEAGEALQFYAFLSFPRFFFLSESDPVSAFLSLEYFQKAEYIREDDIRLPLDDFFTSVLKDDLLSEKIKGYYSKIQGWIKEYIEIKILSPEGFLRIAADHYSSAQEASLSETDDSRYPDFVEFDGIKNFLTQKFRNDMFLVNLNSRSRSWNYKFVHIPHKKSYKRHYYFIETEHPVQKMIRLGLEHFDKSEFKPAIEVYQKALEFFFKQRETADLSIFYYSLILHELANIYFVNTNFKLARDLYTECYSMSTHLDVHLRTFSFDTQLKMLGILSYNPELHTGWDNFLLKYIDNLELNFAGSDRKDAGVSDLFADAYYFLCNGYAQIDDRERFLFAFEKCNAITSEKRDSVGLVKLKVLDYIYMENLDALVELTELIIKMSEEEKRDPYLTTIFGNLGSGRIWKKEQLDSIKVIFLEHKIPLQIEFEV